MATTSARSIKDAFIDHAVGNDWLLYLVDTGLAETLVAFPSSGESESGCLLADIGNYLVRCIATLSQLADGLANGSHIGMYATQGIEYMVETSEFSDLELLSYMNNKHRSLQQIASHIQVAAQKIRSDWQQSTKPPEASKRLGKRPIPSNSSYQVNHHAHAQIESWKVYSSGEASDSEPSLNPVHAPEAVTNATVDSPNSDDSIYNAIQDCLSSLSSTTRGKGSYFCPLGTRCTKGGVASDGAVIQFVRNSSFKSHLQKHEKAYKCDLPGCKNKKGFARSDQLRRHRETVTHHPSPSEPS